MALWQVVCGLCAVLCVARVKTHREPFASFKAPRGEPVCIEGVISSTLMSTTTLQLVVVCFIRLNV